MTLTRSAAALGAVAILAGAAAGCGSGSSSTSSSAAPAKLVVWRMGSSVPSQVTWMNGVVAQFHKKYPAYAKTKVVVDWIPWGNRVTDWTNALTSGKGGPDITELGNTDTPGIAAQGALANISPQVHSWSSGSGIIPGNLANDTVNGQTYAVPWFGGVRGIWYRKDEFAKAGISSAPTTWSQLVADAKLLQQKFPGHLRPGRAEQLHQRHRQLHLGRGRPGRRAERRQVDRQADQPAVRGRPQVLRGPVPDPARVAVEVHRPDRTGRARRHFRRLG